MSTRLGFQKVAAILREARGYVEKSWHRGSWAVTDQGRPCLPNDRNAVAWCASGAVCAAGRGPDGYRWEEVLALRALAKGARMASGDHDNDGFDHLVTWIADWQDGGSDDGEVTKEDVLAAFDRAIAATDAKVEAWPR